MSKRRRGRAVLTLVLAALLLNPAPGQAGRRARLAPFRGLGAWVDIYDDPGWADPAGTVAVMASLGVRTLYLQTCNYRCKNALHREEFMGAWIDSAHANGMRIVAWYLPGFDQLGRDLERSMAAIDFRTASGQRFDAFALDIEARIVTSVAKRNARILELSRKIRAQAGRRYPLGAITPPWFYEWGGPFPYAGLANIYDAFIPMIYFSGRTNSAHGARVHTSRNIEEIRVGTGSNKTPIHAIGGIADELNEKETGAFVRTALRRKAIGASLYDYFTSGAEDWEQLARAA
jgi:hypothetical protein